MTNATQKTEWTIPQVLAATGGRLVQEGQAPVFDGVCTDSRQIRPAELFVALVGPNHDAHTYCGQVAAGGVKGVLIDEAHAGQVARELASHPDTACVAVPETTRALGDLARYHRQRMPASLVAVTGSNGKTSTREMTASVLNRHFAVHASKGNFNNEIGLPLTVLQIQPAHQWAVVELGMNHPGEIRALGNICRPDHGVITNIAPAHLEGLGSVEAVMHAKGELLETIDPQGCAILNADDPRVMQLAAKWSGPLMRFGLGHEAEVRAQGIRTAVDGVTFTLVLPAGSCEVRLSVFGTFMVSNALAAAAVGHRLGLTLPVIKAGLEAFRPVKGRMNITTTADGIHLIDDTYNANPGSMQAALTTLKALKKDGRGIVVLGDMFELGEHAPVLHAQIGTYAADIRPARFYAAGEFAATMTDAARKAGLEAGRLFVGSREEILADLKTYLHPGDWVLVKGSRGMAMELVSNGLRN